MSGRPARKDQIPTEERSALTHDGWPPERTECEPESELHVETVDPLSDARWPVFVEGFPGSLPFHGRQWIGALRDSFGYLARCYALADPDGRFVAVWPAMTVNSVVTGKRNVCLPFSHRAGPLIATAEHGRLLFDAVKADCSKQGVASIEVRDWPLEIPTPVQLKTASPFVRHQVDLSGGVGPVWDRLTKDMRYSIRRAERDGVRARIASTPEDLKTFYDMYSRQRRHQKLIPQPLRFVREVFERFAGMGCAHFVLAERHGVPVAGALSLSNGRICIGTHSAATAEARTCRATPLAMWRSVQIACEAGCTSYDFGRTDRAAAGLRHFKSEWGSEEIELPYFFYPRARGFNSRAPSGLGKFLLAAYAKVVPEPLYSAVGSATYRHLG